MERDARGPGRGDAGARKGAGPRRRPGSEAAEELAGALRGQLTRAGRGESPAGGARSGPAEADEVDQVGEERQARLDELDAALVARTGEWDELAADG